MQRIHVSADARMAVQSSEKCQANIFESYIAGYFESIIHPSSDGADDDNTVTEGQAYDAVSAWLVPIFTPIAEFIRHTFQAEQQRLTRHSNGDGEGDGDDDDNIDPAVVVGSSARLNEHFTGHVRTGLPQYLHSPTEGLLWITTCTVTLRDGQKL